MRNHLVMGEYTISYKWQNLLNQYNHCSNQNLKYLTKIEKIII